MNKQLFLSIDFDGTIVEEGFPGIGKIKPRTVELMKQAKELGHVIIVWTARSVEYLVHAKLFLDENNIPYDYINENPEDEYAKKGIQGRKLFSHVYLDDRAVHVDDIEEVFHMLGLENRKYGYLMRDIPIVEPYYFDKRKKEVLTNFDDLVVMEEGEKVEILKVFSSNKLGSKLAVVFSEKHSESTVVSYDFLEFAVKRS
jgi:hydroxymethylpyrimidine pyrophosphatase-like HAD family hydrolase